MKQIFINLPVENVERSLKFYMQLGFSINPLFTDDEQKCMVWNDHIYLMLMSYEKFEAYSGRTIPDIKQYGTSFYTLPVERIDHVNEMVESGLNAGGREPIPMMDYGFMQLEKSKIPMDIRGILFIWIYVSSGTNSFG